MGKRECKFEFDGDLTAKLGGLAANSYSILKQTLYPGAGALADEIKKRLSGHKRTGDLADSVTIVQMDQNGGKVNTAVIFAGYDENGVPNAIKAAVLESGSSKQKKTPFIRPAVAAVRARSAMLMQERLDEIINAEMEK